MVSSSVTRRCGPRFGHRHRDLGDGPALPDDAQVSDAPLAMHGDADLGDYRADELFAFAHRGGGCIEDRADVGAGGGDPGQFFFGQRDRAAGALGGQIVLGGTHGGKLCFQSLLQSPCHQTILRLDVVELAQRPVGLVTGAFDRQLEHRQVAPIVGVGLGQGLGGGGQRCGGQHVEHLVEDLVLQPDRRRCFGRRARRHRAAWRGRTHSAGSCPWCPSSRSA